VNVVWDTARRELLHLRRDRRLLGTLLVGPLLLTLLFGYAFESNAVTDIPVAVLDSDGSAESRELLGAWADIRPPGSASPMLRFTPLPGADDEARAALESGRFTAAVVIPAGFGDGLAGRTPGGPRRVRIVLHTDGTDTITGPQVQVVLREAVARMNAAVAERMLARARENPLAASLLSRQTADALVESVELSTPTAMFNPQANFLSYMLPGITAMALMLMTVTPMAGQVAREREEGTLEQIAVSPAPGWALLAGKVLPYFAVAALEAGCIAAVAHLWFGLAPNGSVWLLGLCVLMLIPASLAVGLVLGVISSTRMQAVQAAMAYLMPAVMLSGAYSPLETIPEPARQVSRLFVPTYFCRAFRDVWFRAAGLDAVAGDLAWLAGFAAVGFAAAAWLFKLRRE
jgi:ABC-2 type transport system permease protein